jgi:hypothetical protein
MHTKTLSTTLALAAAALFLGACEKDKGPTKEPGSDAAGTETDASGDAKTDDTASKKMKCFGVNSCSGQSACDVPDGRVAPGSKGHACAGQNECAKKGWILLTAAECSDKGGEPV